MALLRLHFPWGFLFTTSGYAAMAAVATWYLSTDLHGHLWLRCALHAGGGALLGAVAWRLSERMTDWVNLHTSPLLRLGLPGAAAAVLAASATGPFCELAVGTGMLWPEAACALLFFAVGLAPMVAGVTLLAGLETMLAARRGGGGTVQALRPIWRHLAAGAVLGAASAYAAVELQPQIEHAMVALAPDRVRTSEWLAAEQRLFVSVHALWNCEVLVVPFAAGSPSVDRPARSLITRYVAAELAARSGKCVADPTLVARALGSRRRAVAEADVEALADAMNARWVVRGSITRDEEQPKLTLALRLDQRSGPKQWGRGAPTQWGPLEFSDELPPEAAFARIARQVAEGLGLELEAGADAAPSAHPAGVIALPTTPAELTAAAESPLASARALQLLAALHHPSDVDGEHLWERSLVALRGLPAEDQNARVLRARAALHLYRRPYALSLLQGLADPEAHALMAVGNGNLVTAEPLARAVKDPAGALTLQLEIESLRSAYGKTARVGRAPSGAPRQSSRLRGAPVCRHVGQRVRSWTGAGHDRQAARCRRHGAAPWADAGARGARGAAAGRAGGRPGRCHRTWPQSCLARACDGLAQPAGIRSTRSLGCGRCPVRGGARSGHRSGAQPCCLR